MRTTIEIRISFADTLNTMREWLGRERCHHSSVRHLNRDRLVSEAAAPQRETARCLGPSAIAQAFPAADVQSPGYRTARTRTSAARPPIGGSYRVAALARWHAPPSPAGPSLGWRRLLGAGFLSAPAPSPRHCFCRENRPTARHSAPKRPGPAAARGCIRCGCRRRRRRKSIQRHRRVRGSGGWRVARCLGLGSIRSTEVGHEVRSQQLPSREAVAARGIPLG
jgi:hypothetical protein